jgi:hypothetical protein
MHIYVGDGIVVIPVQLPSTASPNEVAGESLSIIDSDLHMTLIEQFHA